MKAVRFDKYGGTEVLHIADIPIPTPTRGKVLVKVKAAAINPGESAIRKGLTADKWPATFPSGEGSDFAGIVEGVDDSVTGYDKGDEVIGFTNERASHAEYILADAGNLTRKPSKVSWEEAGSLFVVGTTAYATVRAVDVKEGETVVISAAAGGVGSLAVQLAKNKGATVIGIASQANHEWLKQHNVIPVAYGDNLEEDLLKVSNGKIDAFIDTHGKGYVDMAIKLGVAPERINTIIDFAAAKKYNVKTDGNSTAAKADVLAELANMIADDNLEVPIAQTYPLSQVREAYNEIDKGHTRGKIVLIL